MFICASREGVTRVKSGMHLFWADESGASAIEYGLVAGIICVGLAIGLTSMKAALVALLGRVVELF